MENLKMVLFLQAKGKGSSKTSIYTAQAKHALLGSFFNLIEQMLLITYVFL